MPSGIITTYLTSRLVVGIDVQTGRLALTATLSVENSFDNRAERYSRDRMPLR